jgi:hypothetical protein
LGEAENERVFGGDNHCDFVSSSQPVMSASRSD